MEMEFGWWWCTLEMPCLMMMQLGDALMMPYVFIDALMMPYVFIVFIDACGWIPCHMMPSSQDGDDLALITWWRWPCLDHLDGDDLHWWRWLLNEFRPWWGWHDSLMEMTWWCLALIRWWRWHDDVLPWLICWWHTLLMMTWYIHVDGMLMSLWALWWGILYPFTHLTLR